MAKSPSLSLFCCFQPFINEALVEFGISKKAATTGYAGGVLECITWLGNLLTMAVSLLTA